MSESEVRAELVRRVAVLESLCDSYEETVARVERERDEAQTKYALWLGSYEGAEKSNNRLLNGMRAAMAGVCEVGYMDRSLIDFVRALRVTIEEQTCNAIGDSALIAVLCDAARCAWELSEMASGQWVTAHDRALVVEQAERIEKLTAERDTARSARNQAQDALVAVLRRAERAERERDDAPLSTASRDD